MANSFQGLLPHLKALHKVPASAAVFKLLGSLPLTAVSLPRRPSVSLYFSLTGDLSGTRGGGGGGEVLFNGLEFHFCKMRRVLPMEVVTAAR